MGEKSHCCFTLYCRAPSRLRRTKAPKHPNSHALAMQSRFKNLQQCKPQAPYHELHLPGPLGSVRFASTRKRSWIFVMCIGIAGDDEAPPEDPGADGDDEGPPEDPGADGPWFSCLVAFASPTEGEAVARPDVGMFLNSVGETDESTTELDEPGEDARSTAAGGSTGGEGPCRLCFSNASIASSSSHGNESPASLQASRECLALACCSIAHRPRFHLQQIGHL